MIVMKKIVFLSFCLSILYFSPLRAQTPRIGLGLDVLGPVGLASMHLSLDVANHVELSIGGGFIGAYGGAKYYFLEREDWRFYAGAYYTSFTRFYDFDIFSGFFSGSASGLYIPVGIEFLRSEHLCSSFELAYRSLETGMDPYLPVYPCTKISYKF
jgi:hypothetical protein